MLTRKAMMNAVAAAALVPVPVRAQPAGGGRIIALKAALTRQDTLAYQAAKLGMLFGSMIGRGFFADADYMHTVRRECSLICATLISAGVTRRSASGFDFRLGDQQVAFAKSNDLAVDGGYLAVHGAEPSWITPDTDRATALAELQRIVTATISRYAGQLDHWIVVNEAISPKGLRPCTWLSAVGPEYIAEAFKSARRAAPDAVLVLNENNLEGEGVDAKRAVMLDLLTSLVKAGVPIDAVGLQAHLPTDRKVDKPALDRFLTSVQHLGLKIVVTELDVFDGRLPSDVAQRDATVAQILSDFLTTLLKHRGVTAISVWGLSDKYSWYNMNGTPAVLRREDGVPSRGTLLDDDLSRKPGYFAVRAALAAAAHA